MTNKTESDFRPYTIQVTSRKQSALLNAAPELLEALELLLAEHREFCEGGALPAEDVARAAIAKAKGEP